MKMKDGRDFSEVKGSLNPKDMLILPGAFMKLVLKYKGNILKVLDTMGRAGLGGKDIADFHRTGDQEVFIK